MYTLESKVQRSWLAPNHTVKDGRAGGTTQCLWPHLECGVLAFGNMLFDSQVRGHRAEAFLIAQYLPHEEPCLEPHTCLLNEYRNRHILIWLEYFKLLSNIENTGPSNEVILHPFLFCSCWMWLSLDAKLGVVTLTKVSSSLGTTVSLTYVAMCDRQFLPQRNRRYLSKRWRKPYMRIK